MTWSVPRMWPDETVVVLGGGESLTKEQVDHCRGKCRVIAINRAYRLAPWADWLWGGDADRFWFNHPDAVDFVGIKTVARAATKKSPSYWAQLERLTNAGVEVLCHSSREHPALVLAHEGCSSDPGVVRGNNSCGSMLSIVAHTGVARVLLLGIDVGGGYWFEDGRLRPNYAKIESTYAVYARDLADMGVEVVNCSPVSRDTLPFRHEPLEDVL